MSIDCHLKLKGVEGESQHKDHQGEIEVLSWNWSVTNASSAGTGGGSGVGKATPGDFVFSHVYDKAAPVIAKNCASGKHFEEAVVTVRKSGEGQLDFLKCTMKQVFISSTNIGANAGGEVGETVHLSFGDIEFAYKAQDDKGKLGGEVKFGWNPAKTEIR
jgi:type VI secretion system secreted protein Hcp